MPEDIKVLKTIRKENHNLQSAYHDMTLKLNRLSSSKYKVDNAVKNGAGWFVVTPDIADTVEDIDGDVCVYLYDRDDDAFVVGNVFVVRIDVDADVSLIVVGAELLRDDASVVFKHRKRNLSRRLERAIVPNLGHDIVLQQPVMCVDCYINRLIDERM